jgi:hypothetical protein
MSFGLVRVRLENGMETNVGAEHAANSGLTILDEPTHRGDGTLRPRTRRNGRRNKPKTSVSDEAARKKTRGGQSTPDAEEAPA